MIEYVKEIIIPYMNSTRTFFAEDTPAVAIMDNFKGQITSARMSF